ncbi:DNA-directed RNA polymerase I subunit RPA49 isoform X1 [Alosa sapidissima]|uniref:DNA-directed RNA polymerase I subunit RPA49 isoform X1 n=1 Tax=Alosa sapidissima TaxID=34773 RepID=UPI001C099397|nr:DNA-directed RNA polymerase I subunit RPA49 isoform X1 [Alosa sapidissima]
MAASSYTWKCCEEEKEDDNVAVLQFSNGNVTNTDQLDFNYYKNVLASNPRKRNRRILVAESNRLSYVGNNFGTGSLRCNNMCKYYVGVLDKTSMQMEVHSAQLFNMQPLIPGESMPADEPDTKKSYRHKVDSLIEAFGTTKQKRALSSRRNNQVADDSLQQAVAQAASNIIEQKGIEVLQQEVADSEALTDTVLYLPVCNPEADTEEDVYPFNELLSDVEYAALEPVGKKMAGLTSEELLKMREQGCPQTVMRHLEAMPVDPEARDRQARCLWYLSLLIKVAHQKFISRKYFHIHVSVGSEDDCPKIIINKVMKTFTVESFSHGRVKNVVASSMRIKLASYCLALLLHINHQTANLTRLHQDLGLHDSRMIEVAKSMGLKLSKMPAECADQAGFDEHRIATLQLPLMKYERFTQTKKHKKLR